MDVLSMNFVQVCFCEFGLSLFPRLLFVLQPYSDIVYVIGPVIGVIDFIALEVLIWHT